MLEWFVVRTKAHAEEMARQNLRNQGYNVYVPRYRKQIRRARKIEAVVRPLFPGYVFVQIDTRFQPWRPINGTIGVIGIVQLGAGPTPIDANTVEMIRDREDENGVVSLAPTGLQTGDRVVIRKVLLSEHNAVVEEISDRRRVILLLDLMGREVRVNAPLESLAKAS